MELLIRKAAEQDRKAISLLLAHGFETEFSSLDKDMDRIARALQDGLQIPRFFVAEEHGVLIGAAACTDRTGRACYPLLPGLRRHLGPLKGTFASLALRGEFAKPLDYPAGTGCIEFVTTAAQARGKGVAKRLLEGIFRETDYREFILDVTDTNTFAIRAYTALGFHEFKREKLPFFKRMGYTEKIFMRYTPGPEGQRG